MGDKIQYTIRNVPPVIDAKLKAQAKQQGISLNKLLLTKLGVPRPSRQGRPKTYRDLQWMWKLMPLDETRQIDAAVKEARQTDKARAYAQYQAEKERGEWETG